MRSLPLAIPVALGGCWFLDTTLPLHSATSAWVETQPIRRPCRELFEFAWRSIEKQGFTLTTHYDPGERWIESDWQVNLSTRYREGYRQRLEVELLPDESGAVNVRMRARREINDNSQHPTMGERAMWIAAGVDDKHRREMGAPADLLRMTFRNKYFGLSHD